jgi:hypothetical protein
MWACTTPRSAALENALYSCLRTKQEIDDAALEVAAVSRKLPHNINIAWMHHHYSAHISCSILASTRARQVAFFFVRRYNAYS